jgi:hypothetical protein
MRGRNDILPRLPIAQHAQLTTDKSAFSPLDKIALQSTPGWRAIRMECCVHDLPPTPPTEKNLSLLCRNVCDARHKNHRAVLRPERTRRGAPPTRIHSAMCGQSSAYGRATAAKSDQPGRNSSGSLAMLAAMRRASSRTSAWIARLAQALALCAQQRSSFLTSFSALIPGCDSLWLGGARTTSHNDDRSPAQLGLYEAKFLVHVLLAIERARHVENRVK